MLKIILPHLPAIEIKKIGLCINNEMNKARNSEINTKSALI